MSEGVRLGMKNCNVRIHLYPVVVSSRCLHLHPVMGQSQQKMKLFEPTIHSPTPTKQPLFIDSSNINDENKPSAFQTFIDSRRTKSWVKMTEPISWKRILHLSYCTFHQLQSNFFVMYQVSKLIIYFPFHLRLTLLFFLFLSTTDG